MLARMIDPAKLSKQQLLDLVQDQVAKLEAGQASRGQETSGKSQAALIRASALNIKPNMQTGLRDAYAHPPECSACDFL